MEENEQKQIYQIIYKIRYVVKHFTKYDCTHDGLDYDQTRTLNSFCLTIIKKQLLKSYNCN